MTIFLDLRRITFFVLHLLSNAICDLKSEGLNPS